MDGQYQEQFCGLRRFAPDILIGDRPTDRPTDSATAAGQLFLETYRYRHSRRRVAAAAAAVIAVKLGRREGKDRDQFPEH